MDFGIRNPTNDSKPESSSTDEDWNQVLGIRNSRCRIENTRLSWILLHAGRKESHFLKLAIQAS